MVFRGLCVALMSASLVWPIKKKTVRGASGKGALKARRYWMKKPCQQISLKVLDGGGHTPLSEGIPYTRQDYFELVDWTGRVLRADKRGAIDESQAPILKRLGIDEESWIESVTHFQRHFFDVAGSVTSLERYQKAQNQRREKQLGCLPPIERLKGTSASLKLYG